MRKAKTTAHCAEIRKKRRPVGNEITPHINDLPLNLLTKIM